VENSRCGFKFSSNLAQLLLWPCWIKKRKIKSFPPVSSSCASIYVPPNIFVSNYFPFPCLQCPSPYYVFTIIDAPTQYKILSTLMTLQHHQWRPPPTSSIASMPLHLPTIVGPLNHHQIIIPLHHHCHQYHP